jgi:hypothetical protein
MMLVVVTTLMAGAMAVGPIDSDVGFADEMVWVGVAPPASLEQADRAKRNRSTRSAFFHRCDRPLLVPSIIIA